MELLGHRRAADDVAALEYGDLQPLGREIEGADEAVMAGADYDDIAAMFGPWNGERL